jgi:hypothetical protein
MPARRRRRPPAERCNASGGAASGGAAFAIGAAAVRIPEGQEPEGIDLMKAAVFHEANQPLTIEYVEIKKPGRREVLLRTACADLMSLRPAFHGRPVSVSDARGARA